MATAATTRNRRAAQTLVEMNVVIIVLLLMAALITPNVVAMWRSRRTQDTYAAVLRLPEQARNEARATNHPVRLTIVSGSVVVERINDDNEAERIASVSLGEMTVEQARLGDRSVDTSSWQWQVYPDGSSPTGRLEFQVGNRRESLVIPSAGQAYWTEGSVPETLDERWTAGDLEQRSE